MKRIAITQRVEVKPSYGERRDVLDQKWVEFLLSIELWPIPVPNNLRYVREFLEKEEIDGAVAPIYLLGLPGDIDKLKVLLEDI